MHKRHPLFIFLSITAFLVCASILFIQSRQFALFVQKFLVSVVPGDWGIEGSFSELTVKLYPPGVTIVKPQLQFSKKNILGVPSGSTVSAEEIDLIFQPVQMFSRNIRVQKIVIKKGKALVIADDLFLNSGKKNNPFQSKGMSWDTLFQIRTDAIELTDTSIDIQSTQPKLHAEIEAKSLALERIQKSGKNTQFEVRYDFKTHRAELPEAWLAGVKLPEGTENFTGSMQFGSDKVHLEELTFETLGVKVVATGNINGNLMGATELPISLDVRAEGSFDQNLFKLPMVSGQWSSKFKVTGDLMALEKNFQVLGNCKLKNVNANGWILDQVQVEGGWKVSKNENLISIKKVEIESEQLERVASDPGGRAGSGGKIVLGALQFEPKKIGFIDVAASFDKAHLQWLTGPKTSVIFPLHFRFSGNSNLKFSWTFNEQFDWKLSGNGKFSIEQFVLDNQKWKYNFPQKRPKLSKVFEIPEINLDSNFKITPEELTVHSAQIKIGKTVLDAVGSVDFEKGFALSASGPADLKDLKSIAENSIEGVGQVSAKVSGEFDRVLVDINCNLQDASYLRMHFGGLKGNITWDNEPSHLFLRNISASKGNSNYIVNGLVDAGVHEQINLNAEIHRGSLADFHAIFSDFTKDLWWYPAALSGEFTGNAQITGGLKLNELEVQTELSSQAWEYYGERFKEIVVNGGYNRGTYQVNNFKLKKNRAQVSGKISYDTQLDSIDWLIKAPEVNFSDIDYLAKLDLPNRAKMSINSEGHGRFGTINSETALKISQIWISGRLFEPTQVTAYSGEGVTHIRADAFGGQLSASCDYDFDANKKSTLKVNFDRFDFVPFLLILNPKLIEDPDLNGKMTLQLALKFNAGRVDLADGSFDLREMYLKKTGSSYSLLKPISTEILAGTAKFSDIELKGRERLSKISLETRAGAIFGRIAGQVELSLLEFLNPVIERSEGILTFDTELAGTIKAPEVLGRATVEAGLLKIKGLESAFEKTKGQFFYRDKLLTVQSIESDFGAGRFFTNGTVGWDWGHLPKLDLKATLYGNRVKFFPFQYVKGRGKLTLSGGELPYLLKGNLTLEQALSTERVSSFSSGGANFRATQFALPPSLRKEASSIFKLDIDFEADRNIFFKNELLDAEFSAKGKLVNTLEAPRILGNVNLIQGKLNFKDQEFNVQSLDIKFDNSLVINPRFNLASTADISGIQVQMYCSGRLSDYKVTLSSNPSLAEAEILSLLALGVTSTDVKKLSSSDRSTIEKSEAASLVLNTTNFNKELKDRTGFQVHIDESIDNSTGTSVFNSKSDFESTNGPKIVIKRKIGKKLDVSVGSTVGSGTGGKQEVNAEYKVTPGFSIIGVWDTSSDGIQKQDRSDYGIDLKLQKRFK